MPEDYKSQVLNYLASFSAVHKQCNRIEDSPYPGGQPEFLLNNAEFFNPQNKPKEYKWDEIKQCYKNAFWLAQHNPNLTYCEGYAASDGGVFFPCEHAWVVDDNKKVIDTTWRHGGLVYFGVPFKFEFVRKSVFEKKYYGVIDNYQQRFPLITTELGTQPEAWRAWLDREEIIIPKFDFPENKSKL